MLEHLKDPKRINLPSPGGHLPKMGQIPSPPGRKSGGERWTLEQRTNYTYLGVLAGFASCLAYISLSIVWFWIETTIANFQTFFVAKAPF